MKQTYIDPTQQAGADLFARNITGEVVILNLLKFKGVADYKDYPEIAPDELVSGRQAFQKYIDHTIPFLEASGGEILYLGEGGHFLIGPLEQKWDLVMLIKQRSLTDFMSFTTNQQYLAGMGHRNAALADSRLLPLETFAGHYIL